jgi:transcriptional regulator with XRE-family HTH domain
MDTKARGLRGILARNRLQQKHVADAIGVSRVAVWLWAAGRSAPTEENFERLLKFLRRFEPGLTADDLVGRGRRRSRVA